MRRLGEQLRHTLWEMTPRNHRQSDQEFRRRQVVSAVVVLVGAIVLGLSLRIEPGSAWFYPATLGLAVVWAVGAFASGPLHLGRIGHPAEPDLAAPRPVVQPILVGAALALVFILGAFLITSVPWLDDNLSPFIERVLEHAQQGNGLILLFVTVVNGIAEELFFRGAMYAAIPRHQVAVTTVAYTVATLATGNVMLGFAAILLGFIVGLERRASGGILAPILTHLTWSVTMLYALPAIFLGQPT
jgi:membrane protease YdiL (CAAX protease family)